MDPEKSNKRKLTGTGLWRILFGTVLAAFTLYAVLDTFVIPRKMQTGAGSLNLSMFETAAPASSAAPVSSAVPASTAAPASSAAPVSSAVPASTVAAATSATAAAAATPEPTALPDSDPQEDIVIEYKEYYQDGTAIYVADVRLSSAQYLRTAFARDTYGRNVTAYTSSIAAAHNALLAINGDYYGAQERGYVIRNGVIYRSTRSSADVLCVYTDGTMKVVDPKEYTAEQLLADGVWQAFSFGPGLVVDGEISVSVKDEVSRAMNSNPRTAIGMIEPNHFIFVVADGRTWSSAGLSLYELAEFMQSLGAVTAYNLDGGGSSTMYYNGAVVNNPTSGGRTSKERAVSDIIYIGS
ncbi:MAG: phosphodiester glycosidase family protein [Clostridia bacterium]|nr:phosphodiester glycosidase family protein [Clostridia bacterium]